MPTPYPTICGHITINPTIYNLLSALSVIQLMETPSRNDPCPCNSGKKYKDCHMRTYGFSPKEWFLVNINQGNVAPTNHLVSYDGGKNWLPRSGRLALQVRYNDVVKYDEVDYIIDPIAESVPPNRQFFLGLRIKRLRHKLYGVRYHLDNFKKAEDEEIEALNANHVGADHDAVSNNPRLIYEVEAFLFQIKSTLDVLAQLIGMIYHLKQVHTYENDGDTLINGLKISSSKEKRNTPFQLAEILKRHQKWVKDTIDMRDEVTHYSDLQGFSCFIRHAWTGEPTTRISYPSMPNGDRSRTYLESTWTGLLELVDEISPFLVSELNRSTMSIT